MTTTPGPEPTSGTGGAANNTGPDQPQGDAPDSTEQLRADIHHTRQELGDTVQALAAKTDVKARAKDKAEQVKQRVTGQAGHTAQTLKAKAVTAGGQVRGVITELPAKAREVAFQPEAAPAGKAGAAAAATALLVTLWLLRRRARRNADPWHQAARQAKTQVKTVKHQAAAQAKEAGKKVRQQAKAQVAAAKAKANDASARSKARSAR